MSSGCCRCGTSCAAGRPRRRVCLPDPRQTQPVSAGSAPPCACRARARECGGMQLRGTVVLITGASSGIGAATARAIAAAGARPLVAGRDQGRLAAVAAQTGGTALAVDLTAPIRLTCLLAEAMAARGRGHVVFVSSIAGAVGVATEAAYAATKAGINYFAESIRYELRPRGVGVSVVLPGVIDTPFFDRRGVPYQRTRPAPIPPERVARAIISAIERNRAEVVVPGWLRLPVWIRGTAPWLFR